jgi:hypothetical protein
MFRRSLALATLAALSTLTSLGSFGCSADATESAPTTGGPTATTASPLTTSLAKGTTGALTVELFGAKAAETGLFPVGLAVTSNGAEVADAAVSFVPVMAMSNGVSHGAPVLGAATRGASGLFETAAVLQMPSSAMGSWSAKAVVTLPGTAPVEVALPSFPVSDSGRAKTFQLATGDAGMAKKFVASLNLTGSPRVGLNPVVVTLHEMRDMMTFAPVDDATLVLDPQMPSMGHGSPGTVQPAAGANGRYEAQLSFSMAGEWETTLTVRRGGVVIGAPTFTTTF